MVSAVFMVPQHNLYLFNNAVYRLPYYYSRLSDFYGVKTELTLDELNIRCVYLGRDADLVVMVDCQIPSDALIVHFL
jgi:hypothetical protein